jgi:hypothetical protein
MLMTCFFASVVCWCDHRFHSVGARSVNIGKAVTRGLGAGGVPDNGRRAAEESRAEIMQVSCSVLLCSCTLLVRCVGACEIMFGNAVPRIPLYSFALQSRQTPILRRICLALRVATVCIVNVIMGLL